ncbi:MAG: hypothetical protein GWN58_16760, partial [Anaerolineae bacterium]|nr:hypothetical protein [Anaerolineae bacterium]
GDVPQPLRVELVGMGEEHFLQVVGEQGDQRIGLQDSGSLEEGETKSVEVEARDRVAPASESDDSTDLVLIVVIAVLYALIALVLVAIIVLVRRRR